MLMGWGPFRFTVPTYSVESLNRAMSSRVASQPVIGARPPTHLLGPNEETITLQSTFYPHHLNRMGLAQLTGVRQAVASQTPHILVHVGGGIFGRWVARDISDEQTMFDTRGVPQCITVSMTMVYYVSGLGLAAGPQGSIGFGALAPLGF